LRGFNNSLIKKFVPALILLLTLLAACSSATVAPTRAPTPTPTVVQPTPTTAITATAAPTATPFPTGCQATTLLPEPPAVIPPAAEGEASIGPSTALLTIVEYSDFQCPYCAQLDPILKKMLAANPQDLRLVYRNFPLSSIHDKALVTAQAAEAASLQGKFWEMHDALFANQDTWSVMPMDEFMTWLSGQAKALGLDVTKFNADVVAPDVVNKVQNDQRAAEAIGLPGTPFLLMNGLFLGDQVDEATLTYVIDLLKKVYAMAPKRVADCPPVTIDKTKQYIATLNTSKGDIVIQLYPDKAPLAVNSFVYLAQRGWFDGNPFHRVVTDFVAQSGDPSGTGIGNPGYFFVNEFSDLKFDKAGMLGLANSGANSNGSQFFITLAAQPSLDGAYTVFGQVIQGMDVVMQLTHRDPQQGGVLPEPDVINKVTIEVK